MKYAFSLYITYLLCQLVMEVGMEEIKFYHEYDDYGYFSNYWVASITVVML